MVEPVRDWRCCRWVADVCYYWYCCNSSESIGQPCVRMEVRDVVGGLQTCYCFICCSPFKGAQHLHVTRRFLSLWVQRQGLCFKSPGSEYHLLPRLFLYGNLDYYYKITKLQNRYQQLKDELLIEHEEFDIIYLEFTSLGFIGKSSWESINKFLRSLGVNIDRCIYKCMETTIRGSYYIFCRRNKSWEVSELLNFY